MDVGMDEAQIALMENGREIEFRHGELTLGERIPGGYVFVDGTGVGDIDHSTMRDRALLSQDGVVLVNLFLDKENGTYKDLEILSRGFMAQDESVELFEELRKRIHRLTLSPSKNMQKEILELN